MHTKRTFVSNSSLGPIAGTRTFAARTMQLQIQRGFPPETAETPLDPPLSAIITATEAYTVMMII